ncbi:MAG: hypothetical protein AB8F95_22135 [Bacteroidia bacterium]
MNFKEKISDYVLGNISISQLPQVGELGLQENLNSESLQILAGMNEKDNSYEIEEYYKKALLELGYKEPNRLSAAKILIVYYLKKIISSPTDCFHLMTIIDNDIYKQENWAQLLNIETRHLGEELGLEKLFTWHREIQDWESGGKLLYYNDLPREKQIVEFEKHLLVEAKELLDSLEKA